jgi:hypothetical protein
MMVACTPKWEHTLISLRWSTKTWVFLGKGRATWELTQGVDMSTLSSMGVLENLNDSIDKPMKRCDNRNKEEHKVMGEHPRMGHVGPRDE